MSIPALRAAALLSCAGMLATLAGCNGCGGVKLQEHKCSTGDCCKTNQDCYNYEKQQGNPDPNNYFCLTSTETCLPIQKECMNDGQCCPGQTCNATAGICQDSYTQCTANSGCNQAAGQYCDMTLGLYPTGSGCTYPTCNPASGNSDCAQGLTCFDGYCLDQPPCGGGCPAGQVCTPVNNFCFQLDNPSASCMQSCAPGNILVFTDGANVFNECNPAEKSDCSCEALPPLQSFDTVLFSDSALTPTSVLVSAYDYDYGDLVLHTYDRTTLAQTNLEWIDGVPTTGAVTGDPTGPRGGRAGLGPDVGRYTSVVYDPTNDTTHIAYYGVDDPTQTPPAPINDLRYAWRTGTSGAWTIVKVDGADTTQADGDVGRYTSITLSPDHAPVIAYFQGAGGGSNALVTGIKVARGQIPQPMASTDFTISVVETESVTPAACSLCTASQTCVAQTGNPTGQCVTKQSSSMCASADGGSACSSTQICGTLDSSGADGGTSSGAPACYTAQTASSLAGLPPGDGLFTGIAYLDNVPVVVWYDNTVGRLKGNIATADSAAQGADFSLNNITVLDDGSGYGTTVHDVGRYASIDIAPASASVPHRIAVAYIDETAYSLNVLTADNQWANITPPSSRLIDSGVQAGQADPILFVGSDTSVKFLGNLISVVYQDQTGETLRFAQQPSASAPLAFKSTLVADGAGGFYARIATDGTSQYATHAIVKAASATQSANTLSIVQIP